MPPTELITPAIDTLKSLDWHMILFVAGIVLAGWAAFLTLGGLEGWILASSLGPWVRGLVFGAAFVMVGGALVLFWAMKVPQDSRPAWISLAAAGGIGGLIAAHVTVVTFWKSWWLRIFLFGGFLGLVVYLAAVVLMAVSGGATMEGLPAVVVGEFVKWDGAGNAAANLAGIARLAIAFAAGGGLYAVVYWLFYPLVWLIRNAALLAAGVILLAVPPIRQTLAGFVRGAPDPQSLRDVASENVALIAAIAGGSFVAVAWAMWAQNFSRTFRNFSRKVMGTEYGTFGLMTMAAGSTGSVFSTLARMLTFRRASAEHCRILEAHQDEEEEEGQEEEHPAKRAKKKPADGKSAGRKA